MEKIMKTAQKTSKEEAFEKLETAIEELDTLTRAFEIINEACRETEEEDLSFQGCSNKFIMN